MKRRIYVGQYAGGESCGVHVLSVDDETGEIEATGFVGGFPNTIWLALSADGARLYAARDAGITAFDVRGTHLVRSAGCEIGHTQPCHMSLSSDGRRLYFAEYADAVCGMVDLESWSVVSTTLVGSGPNLPRQEKAHAHCAVETPDGRFLCVVDLGSDAIWLFDALTMELHGRVETTPGAGPRHLAFHPSGKFAYLVYELGNIVTSFRYEYGGFSPTGTQSLLPSDFSSQSQAAALKLSDDGRRLFATNRGHDSVAAFDVDSGTGKLSPAAISPLGGSWPRDFTILPGERIALACLERAGEVRSFRYEKATGQFTPTPHVIRTHRPVVSVTCAACSV